MIRSQRFCLLILLLLPFGSVRAELPADTSGNRKLKAVVLGETIIGAGSLAGLYSLWYADYPRSSFHLINDSKEWRGMDKAGHAMTSYYLGIVGHESLKWAGMKEEASVWYGGMIGFAYLGIVEVFDGFSAEWGASPMDFACNTAGTALFITQQLAWKEQKILLKWSFHLTGQAKHNEEQLGRNFAERMLKDYNGQTYWLSANLKSLTGLNIPPWLNIAAGYGAEGMLAPHQNPDEINGILMPDLKRRSQFYLSPDIDLTRIKTRNKTLNLFLSAFGFIKFPMPALEYSGQKVKFHFLYF